MLLELISVKDKLDQGDIKPPEQIVGGLLFRKTVAALGAPDDSFKTNWMLQLAISLAAGIPCYSYSCKKSTVVCLILEGGEDYILERIEEKIEAMKLNRDDVMSRIYVKDCSSMQSDDKETTEKMKDVLLSMSPIPDVVVFDPITYALNEDVRFSPERSKLCKNLLDIAQSINGVMLPIIHCRKGAHDDDNMDEFLGTSILADFAATRIKLYRKDNELSVYVKTRYGERPDKTSLVWKYPLLEILPEQLTPRKKAKRAVMDYLKRCPNAESMLSNLLFEVSEETKHNPKTVRSAIENLAVEGGIVIERLSKSAAKVVRLVSKEAICAS
ncbi:AAA family ATPase [Chloroflexota bacterium]